MTATQSSDSLMTVSEGSDASCPISDPRRARTTSGLPLLSTVCEEQGNSGVKPSLQEGAFSSSSVQCSPFVCVSAAAWRGPEAVWPSDLDRFSLTGGTLRLLWATVTG